MNFLAALLFLALLLDDLPRVVRGGVAAVVSIAPSSTSHSFSSSSSSSSSTHSSSTHSTSAVTTAAAAARVRVVERVSAHATCVKLIPSSPSPIRTAADASAATQLSLAPLPPLCVDRAQALGKGTDVLGCPNARGGEERSDGRVRASKVS